MCHKAMLAKFDIQALNRQILVACGFGRIRNLANLQMNIFGKNTT